MIAMVKRNILENRIQKLIFWYAFLMAFPVILIVQNVSFFIFPFLAFTLYSLSGKLFYLRYTVQFIALAFGIGALISVINLPEKMPADSLSLALEVLPNYLYWTILILILTSHWQWIQLSAVYKGIFWGLLFSILYFFVLQNYLIALPLFKNLTQNTFAFLLICFTPIVVWYSLKRFGLWIAIGMLVGLALCGFLSGSRSGSLLTLSGGVVMVILNQKNRRITYFLAFIFFFIAAYLIETPFVKGLVFDLNQRTYSLIYDGKKTLEEDRSYLVRLAQIEKSVLIFDKYPWSGIGLNNFKNYKVKLPGNFVGAEYVIKKKKIDMVSAHNSYFGFLAEGGLLLVVPFILLLGYNIVSFLWNINSVPQEHRPIFVGIIHMSIHLYFIYAILNVFAWFILGLGCMVMVKHRK